MSSVSSSPLIGVSASMAEVRAAIAKVARTLLPVLIEGETGTGKELVAQALHAQSGRRGRFVPFNVGAIPESLFESALFGHVRGAFTGAAHDTDGFLTEADHGTAFFDEIGTLGPALQPKLLRALETGMYRPVGAKHDRRSDFRIVAACNELLLERMDEGDFRADLVHRLSGYVITLPPLRERPEDLPILIHHFVERLQRGAMHFTPDALRLLRRYHWPGNVRELRMFIQRLSVVADPSRVAVRDVETLLLHLHRQPAQLRERTTPYDTQRNATSFHAHDTRVVSDGSPVSRDDPQRAALLEVLRIARGDTLQAARLLGMHRSTLYRHMKQFHVRIDRVRGEPIVDPSSDVHDRDAMPRVFQETSSSTASIRILPRIRMPSRESIGPCEDPNDSH